MKRRAFLKSTGLAIGFFAVGQVAGQTASSGIHSGTGLVVLNPYKKVEWRTIQHHKAALHLHTLQSDGNHLPEEVIRAYGKAEYTILSITDHDWNEPNRKIAGVGWGKLPVEKASPYPKDPKPDNYPANPTWPWTDYGAPSPDDLGLIGIQGSELTYKHHINSYYNNYGIWHGLPGDKIGRQAPYKITDSDGREISEDDQLAAIKNKGGLAILNHPSASDEHGWWERKPLQWYIERYRNHSPRCLVGIEVTNGGAEFNEGLWDQLLARFMPTRPIWGFGNDDMHSLDVKQTCNVFLLNELTDASVREAMESGQFFMFASTKKVDYRQDPVGLSTFPEIKEIKVDEDAGTIAIHATGYDQIKWISAPQSLEPVEDYKTSESPWPLGQVVHVGKTLDIKSNPKLRNYVRAEIIVREGDHVNRILTNPFGIIKKEPSKPVSRNTFMVFGNTYIKSPDLAKTSILASINKAVQDADIDFVIIVGELTISAAVEQFKAVKYVMDHSPVPVYVTASNHDLVYTNGDWESGTPDNFARFSEMLETETEYTLSKGRSCFIMQSHTDSVGTDFTNNELAKLENNTSYDFVYHVIEVSLSGEINRKSKPIIGINGGNKTEVKFAVLGDRHVKVVPIEHKFTDNKDDYLIFKEKEGCVVVDSYVARSLNKSFKINIDRSEGTCSLETL